MGVLIPIEVYNALGVSDHLYHIGAIAGGGLAGLMVVFGLIVMLIRKFTFQESVHIPLLVDILRLLWLLLVAGLGTYMTLIYNTTVGAYEYRLSIGPWFRSLFTFNPQCGINVGGSHSI